jgi:hypothetical protein
MIFIPCSSICCSYACLLLPAHSTSTSTASELLAHSSLFSSRPATHLWMVSCYCQDGLLQLLFGIACTSPRHRVVEQHTVARRATVALPPGRTAAAEANLWCLRDLELGF